MKVIHVVPRIADESSGPSHTVVRLCQAQQALGAKVALHILEPLPDRDLGLDVHAYPAAGFPGAERLGWSPAFCRELRKAAQGADIIHNHSLWMMPNIYCYEAAESAGARLVISPRGTLSEWALKRSRYRKKLVWWYGQRKALFGANGLHATSDMEKEDIRRAGLSQPVIVAANGVDVPDELPLSDKEKIPRTLLFLGRIHPTKGVDLLLKAWASLQGRFPGWELQIAGPLDHEYGQQMTQQVEQQRLERVRFLGEVKGEQKARVFASADLFVLPTNTENFGLAVAEALAHGTPAIVTRGAPWQGLETERCGWWIERDLAVLIDTLTHAMSLNREALSNAGQKGREWMARDFSWSSVASLTLDFYRELLHGRQAAA